MEKIFKSMAVCVIACLLAMQEARAGIVDGNIIMDQDMGENLCALTFDDGPSRFTPELLDMLASHGIRATFFMLGRNAQLYPEIVRRVIKEGHEIGNHSWSHPNLRKLSTDAQDREIEQTDEMLRSLGAAPLYMRPPYGSFDERTVKIADRIGVSIILWSMDSYDWKRLPEDYARIISTRGTVYEPGELRGVFLFHDIHKTTVDDIPRIIANLRQGGCQKFVTVSEYLRGLQDPEPPMHMTRRPPSQPVTEPVFVLRAGPAPLARCSRPYKTSPLSLDDAQAAVQQPETIH